MSKATIDLDNLTATLLDSFPRFIREEQDLAVQLYRELAKGQPVDRESLADALGMQHENAVEILDQWPSLVYYDDQKRVIGFGGLTVAPMQHRLLIDGKELYTWCAWDSLFIPELLGKTARIESRCPQTKASIGLTVTPDGVRDVEPASAVMSFGLPEAEKIRTNVIANFCHYVFYLSSAESGERWVRKQPGLFVLSLDEAFEVGKRWSGSVFGAARQAPRVVGSRRGMTKGAV